VNKTLLTLNKNGSMIFGGLVLVLVACAGGDEGSPPAPPETDYSVSGTIQASENAVIDSDVNDPLAAYTANDSIFDPQPIPNPATVGGYVNRPGTGATGRSQLGGDPTDYFRVNLADGQTITLFIADPDAADLDLYLYDTPGDPPVDASMGTGPTESVAAGPAGTYFIQVFADSGATNYNLTVGAASAAADPGGLRLRHEFVPWEVIVRFEEGHDALRSIATADGLAAAVGLQRRAGAADREMLMGIDNEADRQRAFEALGLDQEMPVENRQRAADSTIRKLDTLALVKSLRRRPEVRSAEPNYIRRLALTPDDPSFVRQWHYPLINLPQAWNLTTGDNTVIVAVIDTGVLLSHPDLAGRLTAGYDFIRSTAVSLDGNGIDADPDDPGDQATGGSSFHGTHVAGTIAATTNNSQGVAGATWNTQIMPLRALGRGGGTSYDVMQSVRYAAGLNNDSPVVLTEPADIINLSLGGGGFSQSEQDVYTAARNQGAIIIAAAGNASSSAPSYPAGYDGVVSVSAVDADKKLAWYSNFGRTIDVAAPGGNTGADANLDGLPDGVLSTCGDDTGGSIRFTYCFYQGTSMAAPHMAGVAALMKAQDSGLTPDDLDAWLAGASITEDLGPLGRDDSYGYGLIDALKAVTSAAAGVVPAILSAGPASVSFGPSAGAKTLELEHGGSSGSNMIAITDLSVNARWLTVTPSVPLPVVLNPRDTTQLTLAVDRTHPDLASDGIYAARVVISSDAVNDPVRVSVSVEVGTSFVGGNAGLHFVLLVDPETLFSLDQVAVAYDPARKGYPYRFNNVPPGTYRILAGTDSDNDFFIGDPGEAFGAYLTVDQPEPVTVIEDRGGLDFPTGFDFNLSGTRSGADSSDTGGYYLRMAPGGMRHPQ
jgi:serine protease